jgi:septum formation inhibitor MinC
MQLRARVTNVALTIAVMALTALTALMGLTACDRGASHARAPAVACSLTRGDTVAMAAQARDTVARLKGRAQAVTLISPIRSGVSIRTEDADSTAFHNGGAVSFDCSMRVTSVWLDMG